MSGRLSGGLDCQGNCLGIDRGIVRKIVRERRGDWQSPGPWSLCSSKWDMEEEVEEEGGRYSGPGRGVGGGRRKKKKNSPAPSSVKCRKNVEQAKRGGEKMKNESFLL